MKLQMKDLRRAQRAVRRRPYRKGCRPFVERLETRLAPANVDVLSNHYDSFLGGANTQEAVLNPSNVNPTTFGKLASQQVDGYVYAQPLYKGNLMIGGVAHNVAYVATEHDSVYAFDIADSPTAGVTVSQIWRTSFLGPNVSTVPAPQDVISGDIVPEVGITGTPVIDPATSTLYVVAKTKEIVGTTAHYVQKLHALDLATGGEKFGGPATIGDTVIGGPDGGYTNTTNVSVTGTGDGHDGSTVRFNALRELHRPALTLANGIVYASFASHGDNGPYHGWVIGYRANNLSLPPAKVFNTSPNGGLAGIWQSGGGVATDLQGNLYLATGNGTFSANQGGPTSLGGGGGSLGYEGLSRSVAVTFRTFNPSNQIGLGINGSFVGQVPITGIDFNAAAHATPPHTFSVTIGYNGTTLSASITDVTTSTPFTAPPQTVNIPATIGSSSGWVGFTGATGGLNVEQDVQTWTYTTGGSTVIDHSTGFASHADLVNNGNATYVGTAAQLTQHENGRTGSVFSRNQVNVSNFSTTFTFQMVGGTNPIADGMTFTIQNSPQGRDYGESVVKLDPSGAMVPMPVLDYFTPHEFQLLNQNDADLGSGGTMLLPDAVGSAAHPHLMVETGKSAKIYLIDRDTGRMGGVNNPPDGPDLNVQTAQLGPVGVWGNPAYLQVNPTTGYIYYQGSGDVMKAFSIANGVISTPPVTQSDDSFNFPGSQPSISRNGTDNSTAIAWALKVDNYGSSGPATLFAYNALNLHQRLYSSGQLGLRDQLSGSVKFIFSPVTNGHVLVGTQYSFSVFGLFPGATAVPDARQNLSGTPLTGGRQIQLTWSNPAPTPGAAPTGIKVLRSTDGVTFSQVNTVARDATSYLDSGLTPSTLYYYQVVATNQVGDSPPSNTAVIRTRVAAPVLRVADVCVGSITLSWTDTANDHYDIERGDANGMNFTLIATVPATGGGGGRSDPTFTDTGLANGTYTYRVTGFSVFDEGTDSAVSNVAKGTIGPVNVVHGTPGSQLPGFQDHSDMQSNGSAQFTNENLLRLTNSFGQAGSAFTLQQVGARGFATSFDIRLHEGGDNPADGLTFTLQGNNPSALGGGGGAIGYQGIGRSVAVKFKIWQNPGDPSANTTGLLFNGEDPTHNGINLDGTGINLRSQSPKQITLTYNGTTLTERIEDLFSHAVFTHDYPNLDIPSFVGGDTAYVGFTAGTGGAFDLDDILNWRYTEQEGNLVPRAPGDLRITSVDRHDHNRSDINIAWLCNNAYTAQGFIIEKSTDGINYATLATVDNGTTTFTDERVGAEPEATDPVTFYYRVRSFNDVGVSRPSNVDSVKLFGGDRGLTIDHSTGFAAHNDLTANGATFSPDPLGVGTFLGHQDIGNVGIPGSASFASGTYTVRGSGADIWDVADGFQFVYKRLNGNGEIIARVTSTQFTDFFSKAGVMFREGLDANSKNALMLLFPPGHNNVEFGRRIETSGCCFADGADISVRPQWVRLVRSGNNFSAFRSDNGTSWIQVGPTVTINMSTIAYVGLAVTAHNNGALNTATFDNVNIIGDTSPPLPPTVARLTDGAFGEANTIFTNNRVGISTFTTSFTYQVQPRIGSADGLTFVIQGNSPNARGGGGGGLGYTGIGRSVAVKFDIWNLASHRSSTGIYFDGEPPDSADGRTRSVFMDTDPNPANRIDFNNGHVFRIDFSYDGTTLTETVRDTGGTATFTTSYTVDILAHVGSNFGYVGFSGGTGGETAVQDVGTWIYNLGPSGGDPNIPTRAGTLVANAALWPLRGPNGGSGFGLEAGVPAATTRPESRDSDQAAFETNGAPPGAAQWIGNLSRARRLSTDRVAHKEAVDQVFLQDLPEVF